VLFSLLYCLLVQNLRESAEIELFFNARGSHTEAV